MQKYYYSCSISTISALRSFYGDPAGEDEIIKENNINIDKTGMSPDDMFEYLGKSLSGKKVIMKSYLRDSEVLRLITSQLRDSIPVPVFYSTVDITDKTRFGTHYSTVIGIDFTTCAVTIANVYGYREVLSFNTFLSYLKHHNSSYKRIFMIELAKFLGVIRDNTVYQIN
jgi:hypothetical protein